RAPSRVRLHSVLDIAFGFHLEMKPKLVGHPPLGRAGNEERAKARSESGELAHVDLRRSRSSQRHLDGRREAVPAVDLRAKGTPAGRSEAIVASLPPVLGDVPLARNETAILETLQGRIQRALIRLELAA